MTFEFLSDQGRFLFRQITRIAMGARPDIQATSPLWHDPSIYRDSEEYFQRWGSTIESLFTHWQSIEFAELVWTAARAIHTCTVGASANSATHDQGERAFSLLKQTVGYALPILGIVGGEVHGDYKSLNPNDNRFAYIEVGDVSTNSSLASRFSYWFCFHYRDSDDEGEIIADCGEGWTRQAIELSMHEFKHLFTGLSRIVDWTTYDNSIDSPHEIDARLFQRLSYVVAQQLWAVPELRGQTLFPELVGPISLDPFDLRAPVMSFLQAAEVLRLAVDQHRSENGFTYYLERIHAVADFTAKSALRLREIDTRLGYRDACKYMEQRDSFENELIELIRSEVSEVARWGIEWLGYHYASMSSATSLNSDERELSALSALNCFRALLEGQKRPRYFRYMFAIAHQHSFFQRQSEWFVWHQFSHFFVSCWSTPKFLASVNSHIASLEKKLTMRVGPNFTDLFNEARNRAVNTLSSVIPPQIPVNHRIAFADRWMNYCETIREILAAGSIRPQFAANGVHLGQEVSLWQDSTQQLPFSDWLRSALSIIVVQEPYNGPDSVDPVILDIIGASTVWHGYGRRLSYGVAPTPEEMLICRAVALAFAGVHKDFPLFATGLKIRDLLRYFDDALMG